MGAFRDLTGMKFGRLFVVGPRKRQGPHLSWLCRCDCGGEKWVLGYDLWQRKTKSCGCIRQEGPNARHGHARRSGRTRTYTLWKNMLARCYNPRSSQYADYGGRGIRVYDLWWSFDDFLADMGECPEGKTIDRIDNDGHYEPGNCRWASRIQQANNKRNNRMITYQGKTQSLPDWCRELGIPYGRTYQRIHVAKESPESAFDANQRQGLKAK